jgi:hypothetical protein
MKILLFVLGLLSAALILGQLVMGQLILSSGNPRLITAHRHSGYLTVVMVLVYIGLSLSVIASMTRRPQA